VRRFSALALALALLLVLHAVLYLPYVVDDAYISFRYARNLVEGHGLVFNPGERVEGYTNFLWSILIAAALALGLEPRSAAQALGLISGLAALWGTARLSRQLAPARGPRYRLFSPLLLALCGAFAFWCVAGLETAAFTALLVWSVTLWLDARSGRSYVPAALAFAAVALERPEGVLFFGSAALIEACDRLRVSTRGRAACHGLLVFTCIFGAYFAWRWSYYGQLLPNSFYAKVVFGPDRVARGLNYVWSFASLFPVFLLSPLTLLPRRDRARRFEQASASRLMLLTLAYLLYVAAVGGDAMPLGRFIVPVLPLLAPPVAEALDRIGGFAATAARLPHRSALRGLAGAVALAATLVPSLAGQHLVNVVVAGRVTDLGLACGTYLRSHLHAGALIATNTAGALPFAADLPTLDMLGINDVHIAHQPVAGPTQGWLGHERGDGFYVMRRLPDAIVFGNTTGSVEPFYRSDRELLREPQFLILYRLRSVPSSELLPEGPFRQLRLGLGDALTTDQPFEMVYDVGLMIQRFAGGWLTTTRTFASPWRFYFYELRAAESSGSAAASQGAAPARPAISPATRESALALCEDARKDIGRGQDQEAVRQLWRAARTDRTLALPFQYLSNLYYLRGQRRRAAWALWRALEREPQKDLYLKNLAALRQEIYGRSTGRQGRR
jgi:hypothetical protein